MPAWFNEASGKGEFGPIGGERIRRQRVDARFTRSNGDSSIVPGVQRHVSEFLLAAPAWVGAIEIECK
jgi:hypothetical protein